MVEAWLNRKPFQPTVPELVDELFADAPAARDRRLRRRLHRARRQPVRRLARHRAVPHLPVRRGRAVRRRAVPDAGGRRAPRHRRQELAAATAPWSRRCSGRTCSAASPPTPATRCSSMATGRTSARRSARCATSTAGRTRRSGPISGPGPGDRSGSDGALLNVWTMAACYSADPDGTVQLPFDGEGRIRHEVWDRWLAWDPVRMVAAHADALRGLRAIWVDAGRGDDFYLDLGAAPSLRSCGRSASPSRRSASSCSTAAMRTSSGATRSRSASSPSASRPDPGPRGP